MRNLAEKLSSKGSRVGGGGFIRKPKTKKTNDSRDDDDLNLQIGIPINIVKKKTQRI
jgi:hypothetical protein